MVFIEKFNLANNFWTWSTSYNLYFSNEYFYFSTNNISLWVPTCFTLRPRCWSLTYMNIPYEKIFLLVLIKLSNFDIWPNFVLKKVILVRTCCTWAFLVTIKIFHLVSRYLSLLPWPSLELVINRGICVSLFDLCYRFWKAMLFF